MEFLPLFDREIDGLSCLLPLCRYVLCNNFRKIIKITVAILYI